MALTGVEKITSNQIAYWRSKGRGLTLDQLSDRTAELGERLDRGTLWKIENEKRGISLNDAVLLAAALNVPFPLLVLPLNGKLEQVPITRNVSVRADPARRWLLGEEPLDPLGSPAEWIQTARVLDLWAELHEAHEALQNAEGTLRRAEYVEDPTAIREAKSAFADSLLAYQRVREEMTTSEITPPKLPPTWRKVLRDGLGKEV
jgi:hypothetical protein